jgi:hypothetical protein
MLEAARTRAGARRFFARGIRATVFFVLDRKASRLHRRAAQTRK